ncbi:EamA family transporter [Sulfitobacter sp. SK012]|uniref:DMT family transporter n=1 Tax=Sulfitobacter sp. SK012 TaxID=1389005 RepID=UPI000E0B1760|nr:DMT family transporter [Sulfitobacter sp. SK012]AXI45030.1 EamA family transporter [Sulfitobacter sp. SK012]
MSPQLLGHLAMLAFSALVAGSFSLGSLVANDIAPAALNAVRFVLAAAVIGAVIVGRGGGIPPGSFKAPWRYAVLGGLFGFYFVMMFEGLKTAPPVRAAAVFTLVPIMVAGIAWLLLHQRTTRRMALALGIGGAGALWVIFRADLGALLAFDIGRGEAIYFVGCISHAIYTPMVRKLNRGEPLLVFVFGTLVAGAVLLSLAGWRDIIATDWQGLSALVWITILYTALAATAITTFLVQFAALGLPSAKVMAYTYLTPSWVIVWQIMLGGAVPGPLVFGGVALTVLALWLLLRDEA